MQPATRLLFALCALTFPSILLILLFLEVVQQDSLQERRGHR